jgi:MarR family transcriptional regulator, lower aerobic nicotinate degradation pathway regulator
MEATGPLEFGKVLHSADTRAGFALTTLGDAFGRRIRDVLAEHRLQPRQLRILDLLADRGPIGQRELAALMHVDHSVLVNLLNPLEADGLVKRQRDSVDRRRHVVTIAPAGTRRLAKADEAFRAAEDAFFAPLTQEDRALLNGLLSRLREAAASPPADGC